MREENTRKYSMVKGGAGTRKERTNCVGCRKERYRYEEEKADSKEKGVRVNCLGVFDSSVLMLGY